MAEAQRARILGMVLIPFEAGHVVRYGARPTFVRRAKSYGPAVESYVASLRELLGLVGAHEWRKEGVSIRRWADASIRITACFRRYAGNTWRWWRTRRCPVPLAGNSPGWR